MRHAEGTMKELIFGVDYYPEYMKEDRTGQDFAMMKQCGMNTVRIAESTWSTEEREDGVFDFSFIEKVLKEAEKTGMQVIIGTPTYAVPSWLVKKDPEIMVRTKSGQAFYGFRQLINIMNPTYRFHAERIIRKIVAAAAPWKCVIGFQLDNETKHYENFGPEMQAGFLEHLKERFGTPEAMNEAFGLNYWSNAVHSWEDFPDMRGCINASLAGEFERYQRAQAAAFLRWQADIVREICRPDQFITHNMDFEWRKFGAAVAQDGYSYGVQPDIDHVEAAAPLSLAGTDIYHPTQSHLTGKETGFCGDEIRCLKDAPYLILETQAQAFKTWTPYPGQLTLQAFSHFASGAMGMIYWNWHSIHNGYETYWKGILSHDMEENPVYLEAAKIGKLLKEAGKDHLCIRKKNAAALVVDNTSLSAFKWFPIDRDLSYNDVVRWIYDTLFEMNVECDVIHASVLDPADYEVIITPALYCAEDSLIEKLKTFVKNGGTLISTFKSFFSDMDVTARQERQPYALTDCFGMSYQMFAEPERLYAGGKECRYFAELLSPDEAEAVLMYEHRYWGRYAAVTSHAYGSGQAWYIGTYLDRSVLREVLEGIPALARLRTDGETSWPVVIRSGMNEKGRNVHYVLHYSEDEELWRCSYEHVTDLLTGKEYRKGEGILLADWEVLVLEEAETEEKI